MHVQDKMKYLVKELRQIRHALESIQDCEDGEEMIHICLELACDVESLEEQFDD